MHHAVKLPCIKLFALFDIYHLAAVFNGRHLSPNALQIEAILNIASGELPVSFIENHESSDVSPLK
jgi:hypothetical protein